MIAAALLSLVLAAPLSSDDWQREALFAGLAVIDWRQTHDIRRHPGMFELNPTMGRHPSSGHIDRYFAAGILAHAAVTWALPVEYRARWQRVTIVAEAAVVGRNAYIGLKIKF